MTGELHLSVIVFFLEQSVNENWVSKFCIHCKLLWSPTGKARGTSIEIPSYACLREATSAKAGQGLGGLSTGGEIHRSIEF